MAEIKPLPIAWQDAMRANLFDSIYCAIDSTNDDALSVQPNKAREFYITKDMAAKVLDACPDLEWRLIFALARFGGLRTPSETFAVRW